MNDQNKTIHFVQYLPQLDYVQYLRFYKHTALFQLLWSSFHDMVYELAQVANPLSVSAVHKP